jgi:hypothetical protein
MFIGIALSIAAIIGIVNGIVKKNKRLVVGSSILLVFVIAVWIYFYNNPY